MSDRGLRTEPLARAAAWEPWLVWSENDAEAPRRGHGAESMGEALDHLRKRGDKTARYQLGGVASIVKVRLA